MYEKAINREALEVVLWNSSKMSEQFNKIREIALAKIFADFDSKLEGTIESFNESDIRDDDIEIGVSFIVSERFY